MVPGPLGSAPLPSSDWFEFSGLAGDEIIPILATVGPIGEMSRLHPGDVFVLRENPPHSGIQT